MTVDKCVDFDPCIIDTCSETGECEYMPVCDLIKTCLFGKCLDTHCESDDNCHTSDNLCSPNICLNSICVTSKKHCPKQDCLDGICSEDTGLCLDRTSDLSFCKSDCLGSMCYWQKEDNHKSCLKPNDINSNDIYSTSFCGKTETEMFSSTIIDERIFLEK